MNKKKKVAISKKVKNVIDSYASNDIKKTDPQGWYTGQPINKFEKPVQDQDDL